MNPEFTSRVMHGFLFLRIARILVLWTIFFNITMRTFVLSVSMALAFMFAIGCALAFVLSIGMALTLVFTVGCALAFMLAVGMALEFVLTVGGTLALVLAVGMALAFVLSVGGTLALVLASSMALALMFAIGCMLAFVLRSSCVGSMATGSAILATSGQFLAGRGIGLHGIGIVTHFADFLAQYVGVCLFGIVIDRDFRRTGIIRVIFHTFEERNVLFETVNAFLAFEGSVGLDGNTLHLCVCTQCHYGHQGHQDKFFHFYCFINY